MRKILIMLIICISPVTFLAGCQSDTEVSEEEIREMGGVPFDENYGFTKIKEISAPNDGMQRLYLISDNQTRSVYYYSPAVYQKGRNISPYYSENGKLCRFVDNKIVEVE